MANFDHDHSQNSRITVVKWSKLVNLTIDHGQNRGCHGHGQLFLTIDHGVNSRVSWSWSVPYPPPPSYYKSYQSQNAKRASSQKRHMVISIFLLCNSLILMSIGAGSIRAIKGGLDKVFKIRDRLHRICRQILR